MPYQGLGDAHEAALYRALVRNLPEYAIFRIGVSGTIESWNAGVERALGYAEPEFVGLPFSALFTAQDLSARADVEELRTAAAEKRASDTRWHVRKDGTRIFCDGMVTAIENEAGDVIGFTKVMHDITARRTAEQRAAELVHALELTHTIIRTMDGTIVLWTRGAELLYGWSNAEAIGRRTHELLGTQFPEPLDSINKKLLDTGEWQGHLIHVTKSGVSVSVASHWVLHPLPEGVVHVIEVNNDVSELQHVRDELQLLNNRLRSANQELTSFAYEVAHDIQSPLRGITALAELLSSSIRDSVAEEDRDVLLSIVQSGRNLRALVDSLLQYATADKEPAPMDTFPLGDLVEEVSSNLAGTIAETGATVTCNSLPTVRGHRVRILRVLQNLVSNGIKYARPSIPPEVTISARSKPGEWQVDVQDNGQGIPLNEVHRIFAPLTRLHNSNVPGTGLGLAICKRVVESQGGRIWVESVEGKGSTFHFTLPQVSESKEQ